MTLLLRGRAATAAALLALLALLALAAAPAAASNCEAISAGIEAKIRAAGVARFTLGTVDAQAQVPGKVVGTCDRGARKIVYLRGDEAAAAPPASAPAAAPARPAKGSSVITECKDGSMPVDGRCKR